jgi:hypothetical protein
MKYVAENFGILFRSGSQEVPELWTEWILYLTIFVAVPVVVVRVGERMTVLGYIVWFIRV